MKEIDYDQWNRKDVFKYFYNASFPVVALCSPINIYELYEFAKEKKHSFYGVFTYLVTKTLNDIPEFLYNILDGKVIKYDKIFPEVTVINSNNELRFTSQIKGDELEEFLKNFMIAKSFAEENDFVTNKKETKDVIYISCLPKLRINGLINPFLDKDDGILRIIWGKVFKEKGVSKVDLSIHGHHGLIDGYHISQFYLKLDENIKIFLKEKSSEA